MSTLEGASKYLNNLLLSRGLLPNGKSINFAHPAQGTDDADATMSKIINLIHELVLRRDRETEQHEQMATTIRGLRSSETQHVLDFQQLQERNQQLKSDMTTAHSHERTTHANLKKLEGQIKELKEQNLKMKSMLDQVRAKCTNDVRKRDVEIEKLKGHINGIQRGKKDVGGMKINTLNLQLDRTRRAAQETKGRSVHSAHWTLEAETNEFLTALVNETSSENVTLRQIVDDTLHILKDMTGFEDEKPDSQEDAIGIPGQYRNSRRTTETIIPVDSLAERMDAILLHCRSILKDPSFVPIEEVHIREAEIIKLRAGWEKMADRWKEAVTMMGQWKQRMMIEGQSTDAGEFSDLSFGRSVATRPDGQPILSQDSSLSSIFEDSRLDEGTILSSQTGELDESNDRYESELDLQPEQPASNRLIASPARRGVRLFPNSQPLSEMSGNIDRSARNDLKTYPSNSALCSDAGGQDYSPDCEPDKVAILQKLAAIEAEATEVKRAQQHDSSRKRKSRDESESKRSNRRRNTLNSKELAHIMDLR